MISTNKQIWGGYDEKIDPSFFLFIDLDSYHQLYLLYAFPPQRGRYSG
jgi:hypothetical protein